MIARTVGGGSLWFVHGREHRLHRYVTKRNCPPSLNRTGCVLPVKSGELRSSWSLRGLSKPKYECHVAERRRVFRSRGGVMQFHIRPKYCAQTLISYPLHPFLLPFPLSHSLILTLTLTCFLSFASFLSLFLLYPLLLLFYPPFSIAVSFTCTRHERSRQKWETGRSANDGVSMHTGTTASLFQIDR